MFARVVCVAVAAVVLGVRQTPAQAAPQGQGRITGRIVNAESGQPIPGAQVTIVGREGVYLADLDGRYKTGLVPVGRHSLIARRLGLQAKQYDSVTVTDGQATVVNFTLSSAAMALQAVQITAASSATRTASEAGLLSVQQKAPVASDGISAEQISRSPDSDAADAATRVSGVSVIDDKFVVVRGLGERYSNTLLNGVEIASPEPAKKVVPLDVFPASLLESIVVSKSATPDLPGDFAGGSVEIRTKEFPENRILQFNASIGYNSRTTLQQGRFPKWGTTDYLGFNRTRKEPKFLPTDDVALAERGWEAVRRDWNPAAANALPNLGLGVNVGGQTSSESKPLGYVFSLTYSLNNDHTPDRLFRLYLDPRDNPVKSIFYDDARRVVDWGSIANFTWKLGGSNKIGWKNLYSRNAEELYSLSEGANTDRNGAVRAYQYFYVARDLAQTQLTGDHLVKWLASSRLEWKGTFSWARRDEPDNRQATYVRPPGVADFAFGDNADIWYRNLDDKLYSGQADWALPFGFGWIRGSTFKVGGSYRDKTREFKSLLGSFVINRTAPEPNDLRFLPPEQLFSPEIVGSSLVLRFPGQVAQPYSADDNLMAYYGMLDIPFMSRVRLVGGARMEQWSLDLYDGGRATYDPENPATAPLTRRDNDLLWSANATIELTDRMNVRLAAFKSVARPDTREMSRDQYTDFVGNCATIGNPGLQRTAIINGDVRWEWYPSAGELVAVSGFFKDFDNPILRAVNTNNNCSFTYENAVSARNYGGEVDVRRELGFLPGELSRVIAGVNLTYVKSSLVMDPRLGVYDSNITLEGQSPYLVNLSLAYTHPRTGFSATMLFNYFDDRIVRYGVKSQGGLNQNQGPNIVEKGRATLDFKLQHAIRPGVQMSVAGRNLTSSASTLTQQTINGDIFVGRANPGRSMSVGLSYAR